MAHTHAIAVRKSKNRKTGPVAATYAAQQSCPASCPFQGAGCYAEKGRMGLHTRRLNKASKDAEPLDVARSEAAAIDSIARPVPGLPLRLHVVGDCPTSEAARTVADAAERYAERGGGKAWTYTHAWETVDRAEWGNVSVLASVHDLNSAEAASRRGYAPAVVVEMHDSPKAWKDAHGRRWIPCPEQTRGVTCSKCRLCFNADYLRDTRSGIAFAKH